MLCVDKMLFLTMLTRTALSLNDDCDNAPTEEEEDDYKALTEHHPLDDQRLHVCLALLTPTQPTKQQMST